MVGEPHDLVCMIILSSTAQSSSINLTWNFTSNDDRVTVIPTTITTNDSIGIIYTTVIQFDYLMETDEENYTCTLAIDGDSVESTFNLETTSKFKWYSYVRRCISKCAQECYHHVAVYVFIMLESMNIFTMFQLKFSQVISNKSTL